jgi:hypothetical protein
MAQSQVSRTEAASAQDVLLATKLRPPRPRTGFVPRPRSLLANVPAAVAIARADLGRVRGLADTERRFARAAIAQLTEQEELPAAVARYHVAFADWIAGRLAPAERAPATLFSERVATHRRDLALRAAFDLGGSAGSGSAGRGATHLPART